MRVVSFSLMPAVKALASTLAWFYDDHIGTSPSHALGRSRAPVYFQTVVPRPPSALLSPQLHLCVTLLSASDPCDPHRGGSTEHCIHSITFTGRTQDKGSGDSNSLP